MGQKGHTTGMAGEFHVMEILYRRGHEPALTLGQAKSVDILTISPTDKQYKVSVKAMRGGGKWGIGNQDYSKDENLVFVLLWYKQFSDLTKLPEAWVIPAKIAERIKRPWHQQFGIYIYKQDVPSMIQYKDAWDDYLV